MEYFQKHYISYIEMKYRKEEKHKLYWNTYTDHLREMFHEMLKTSELADVTLVSDDLRQFKAHKIVLSACSAVFKQILKDLPQNSSVIYLRGIQHQEMESILQFMYLGETTFDQERMNEVFSRDSDLTTSFVRPYVSPSVTET